MEQAGNAGAGTPRECQKLGAEPGNVWECGFGNFWEGQVVIPWDKHPSGITPEQGWRGDPRGSQASAGICWEQFWDWDLSVSFVPRTIRSNPGVWEVPAGRPGRVRDVVTKIPFFSFSDPARKREFKAGIHRKIPNSFSGAPGPSQADLPNFWSSLLP